MEIVPKRSKPNLKIVVAGAGSIGCFVGGSLLDSGHDVSFLGRQRIADELSRNGLHLTDYTGVSVQIDASRIDIRTEPEVLAYADIILVCVKSSATREMAELIKTHASDSAIVVSLQNGVRNAEVLRSVLTKVDVRAGMVPFNVIQLENGRFHRGSSGDMVIEAGSPDVARLINSTNIVTHQSENMSAVLWGKLLINLNNALNALSDVPLVEQLASRNWRKRFADQISEGLMVLQAEGISPVPPSPVPAWLIPHILRLPTPLFRIIAKRMLEIDPHARTSMWQDLQVGRKTEIDELQGEIIRLGEKHGIPTPGNRETADQIHALEERD